MLSFIGIGIELMEFSKVDGKLAQLFLTDKNCGTGNFINYCKIVTNNKLDYASL